MKPRKTVNFSPILLKVQRKQKLNEDIKDSERGVGMTKQVQTLIDTFPEEKLKAKAKETVKQYIKEAKGEGEFDFLKDEVDEDEKKELQKNRKEFKRKQRLKAQKVL